MLATSGGRCKVDLSVGLMLNLARGIARADSAMKQGRWLKGEALGIELRGKGLMVFGDQLCSDIEAAAKAFEMDLLPAGIALLPNADFVVVDDARMRLDKGMLTSMKNGSCLIAFVPPLNIDIEALREALRLNLRGAALFAPGLAGEFQEFPNLILYDSLVVREA